MIKNIIFDWHGTINDGMEAFFFLVESLFKKNGRKPIPREAIQKEFDIPYMKFWATYAPEMTKEQQDAWYSEIMQNAPKPDIYDGVKENLELLQRMGLRLFVLSSDHADTLIPEAEKYGIKELFDGIRCSVYDKDADIPIMIAELGLLQDETIYVGDTKGDMKAAKKAGLTPVGITWGLHTKDKLLEAGAQVIINNMNELREKVKFVPLP